MARLSDLYPAGRPDRLRLLDGHWVDAHGSRREVAEGAKAAMRMGCGCLLLLAIVGLTALFAPPLALPLVIAGILLMAIWKLFFER
jgi:hypothetical protein